MKRHLARILVIVMMAALFAGLSLVPVAQAAPEVVYTATFETGNDSFTARSSSIARSTEQARTGSYSLKVTGRTSDWNGTQVNLTSYITAGVEYEFSMWVRLVSGGPFNMKLTAQVGGSTYTMFPGSEKSVTSEGWTQLSGRLTFDSTSETISPYIETSGNQTGSATAQYYIDDVAFTRIGDIPEPPDPPGPTGNEINVYLDQERQVFDGALLSGAFRQADLLLNGYADNPAKQREVLDLVFGTEGKGIGLSIWRNMVGDQQYIGNYRWTTYGRWFDGPAPTHKTEATGTGGTLDPATGKSNFDASNYRWWFDATNLTDYSTAATSGAQPLRITDADYAIREGGAQGNSVFDKYDWPEQPENANANVKRNGLAPIDRGQIWAMKEAEQYAAARGEEMKFISSVWSAPAWMKSGTTPQTYTGTVPAEQYQNFADYCADYVEGYEKIYGIKLYGLSVANEPTAGGPAYSACTWSAGNNGTYYQVVNNYVGPTFKNRGITTRLQIGDDMNYNTRFWSPFWQNAASESYVDDYIFHGYGNYTGAHRVNADDFRQAKLRAQMSGDGIWESEISQMNNQSFTVYNYATNATANRAGNNSPSDIGHAIAWGQKWMRQLGVLEINAIGQWWAWGFKRPDPTWPVTGVGSGSTVGDNSLENLIYIVNNSNGTNGNPTGGVATTGANAYDYRVHKVFWSMGHFSKFVRPGWYRVNNSESNIQETSNSLYLNQMTTAYRSPEPDENGYYDIAVVVINGTRNDNTMNLQFPGYTVESLTPWTTTEDGTLASPSRSGTTDGNNMVKGSDITDLSAVNIPAVSMNTFVGKAKPIEGYARNAAESIPGYQYNTLEGSAFFNNDDNLNNPRVEIYPVPATDAAEFGKTTDTTFTYKNLDFGAGMNALTLNIGGGISSQAPALNIEVYADGELVTADNETIAMATAATSRTVKLTKWVQGVHDIEIRLSGAVTNTFRSVLNSLQFSLTGSESLYSAYANYFDMGNVYSGASDNSNATRKSMLTSHYNVLTAENYMKPSNLVASASESYTWTNANSFMAFARDNNFQVHGHTLVWGKDGQGQRTWMNGASINRTQAKANLERYIKTVVEHFDTNYPGMVVSWDVINELFLDEIANVPAGNFDWRNYVRGAANVNNDHWHRAYANGANAAAGERGTDYIYDAFVFARKYTGAKLYYNDFNMYEAGKSAVAAAMVRDLNARYAAEQPLGPDNRKLVEAVGMQAHVYVQDTPAFTASANSAFADVLELNDITAFGDNYDHTVSHPASTRSLENGIQTLIAADVDVVITELDLQVFWPYNGNQNNAPNTILKNRTPAQMTAYWRNRNVTGAQLEQLQAMRFAEYFAVLKKYAKYIDRVTFWGLLDNNSWRAYQNPLLWNSDYTPKTGFIAVSDPEGYLGIDAIDPLPRADKAALKAAIDAFGELKEKDWTVATWTPAQTVYEAALLVYAEQFVEQGDVNNAASALQAAIDSLVEVVAPTLELGQPSQIRLRVNQTYKIALVTNLEPNELTYTPSPQGFLNIDEETGVIRCTKAGGTIILVIKSDIYPDLKPLTVVITTSA